MFGNNINNALDLSLLQNTNEDMYNTPRFLESHEGHKELNPILSRFNTKDKGLYQLYGLLANYALKEITDNVIPDEYLTLTKLLANIAEAYSANSVEATWRIPVYSEVF